MDDQEADKGDEGETDNEEEEEEEDAGHIGSKEENPWENYSFNLQYTGWWRRSWWDQEGHCRQPFTIPIDGE